MRIKVVKAIYAHLQSNSDNLIASQKSLMSSIDKSYDLYFLLLQLPVAMADHARRLQEIAKEKHLATAEDLNPNTRFVDSALVHLIENSDLLNDHMSRRSLGWSQHPELIKLLYNQLSESGKFQEYISNPTSRNIKEDLALMEHFYVTLLQECDEVEDAVESMSMDLCGDLPYVLPLVMRTLSNVRASHTELKIVSQFKGDDDRDFVRSLFERSLVNYAKYQLSVESFMRNWDLERVVLIDNMILVVAMAELIHFPAIPTRVTMDEYIEISKFYSTPNSSTFVNGILDRMTDSLTQQGLIQKSGRGLI